MGIIDKSFQDLKIALLGVKTIDIDKKLDQAVTDITNYRSQSGRNGYIELVKNLISKNTTGFEFNTSGGAFSQGASPAVFGQSGRLTRYKSFEGIASLINYCYRALEVITDNIISPDDITKIALEIKPKKFLEDENPATSKTSGVKSVIKSLKLEDHLRIIVRNTLQFGDYFCELADARTALTSRAFLTENYNQMEMHDLDVGNKEIIAVGDFNIKIDYSYFSETDSDSETDSGSKKDNKKLYLVFHEPCKVIKLQSELFPICFGYLVFPKTAIIPTLNIADMAVNDICKTILKNLEKKLPQMKEFNDLELKDIVASLVFNSSDHNKIMNVRYVPPDRMQHFMRPTTKYYPYGESIFDACQFTAKCLIAMETALTIQRISRSTEKRKIAVEIGLPRDAKKMIEKLKEEFRKRKVSIDSFGSVDTIPSMISTFEDVYIPQKDGKPFVDISTFTEGNVDVRNKVEELRFLRDSCVASLGVPPAFIGLEENLCLISNTYIPLINGSKFRLSEIIEQFKKGVKNMYVYSYNSATGKIVPGLITWAGYTKLQTKCIRVHLDNNEYIDCTPEHPFMLRDGSYIEAQHLKENDSLMPFYTKNSNTTMSSGISYESIYHPGIDKWQLSYHMVSDNFNLKYGKGYVIHHENYNPRNNHPDNLWSITNIEHHRIHGSDKVRHTSGGTLYFDCTCKICGKVFIRAHNINQTTCSKECRKERKRLDGIKSYEKRKKEKGNKLRPDLTCFICGKPSRVSNIELTENVYKQLKNKCLSCEDPKCMESIRVMSVLTKKGTKLTCEIEYKACEICGKIITDSNDKKTMKNVCSIRCMNTVLSRRGAKKKIEAASVKYICEICGEEVEKPKWYVEGIRSKKCDTCRNESKYIRSEVVLERRELSAGLNHKVVRVEVLEGLHDTGDITVEKYHNFALESGIIVHNSNKAALSEENVLFARTVISHQKYFTHQINDLVQKIYDLQNPEEALTILDTVNIAFPAPKSLQFEREARYMAELANLVETLERIGIPREYSKKKYLTGIDWKELEHFEVDSKVEKELGITSTEDETNTTPGIGSY